MNRGVAIQRLAKDERSKTAATSVLTAFMFGVVPAAVCLIIYYTRDGANARCSEDVGYWLLINGAAPAPALEDGRQPLLVCGLRREGQGGGLRISYLVALPTKMSPATHITREPRRETPLRLLVSQPGACDTLCLAPLNGSAWARVRVVAGWVSFGTQCLSLPKLFCLPKPIPDTEPVRYSTTKAAEHICRTYILHAV